MEMIQEISVDDLKEHPDLVLDVLTQPQDIHVSLVVQRKGQQVTIRKKTYDPEFVETMQRIEEKLKSRKEAGYTREQAFQDFFEVQERISQQIKSTE